ncbi:bacterio-opsin activator domain-containing protein [Halobacterium zhouii]|uniref:helix-turn-helix domain-containing protein n=1 Tax=Halobacterium zhouii TaxID=2902624 RepID=UPI001E5F7AFF|nr:helix-turn-helix domain-containing protein [Halobacterium zhouii]
MSVVADITVPATSFLLSEALPSNPDVTIEVERLASHSTEWVMPFLWVSGTDFQSFRDQMQADPTVADVDVIEEIDGSALYMVTWSEDIVDLITDITNQHASILDAKARVDEWRLKLRFALDEQVPTFQEYFAERTRTFEVNKLYHPDAPQQREYGLTPEQYDTLVTAVQVGYFDVPRQSSMDDLADELGVSSNAVSQRIRRGCANLIRHALTVGDEPVEARE